MIRICYCKLGLISECVASDNKSAIHCMGWEAPTSGDHCAFKHRTLGCCTNTKAQDYSKEHGVITPDDLMNYVESKCVSEAIVASCKNCENSMSCEIESQIITNADLHTYYELDAICEETAKVCDHYKYDAAAGIQMPNPAEQDWEAIAPDYEEEDEDVPF